MYVHDCAYACAAPALQVYLDENQRAEDTGFEQYYVGGGWMAFLLCLVVCVCVCVCVSGVYEVSHLGQAIHNLIGFILNRFT